MRYFTFVVTEANINAMTARRLQYHVSKSAWNALIVDQQVDGAKPRWVAVVNDQQLASIIGALCCAQSPVGPTLRRFTDKLLRLTQR